jgi:glycerol-3-phosphate acyltransferase PlsY
MLFIALLLAFFLGSIPFSWLLTLWLKGIDLRTVASGNPGATNAVRVVGWKWGIVALLLDISKGLAAVLIAPLLVAEGPTWLPVAAGCSAILGNVFCPFLKFKGGKAVAAAAGVFLALGPLAFLVTAVIFGLIVWKFNIVSIGSIAAGLILPTLLTVEWWQGVGDKPEFSVLVLAWSTGLIIVARHRANIRKILSGKEGHLVGPKNENE